MEDGSVAYGDVFAHRYRQAGVHVDHTVILNIAALADGDGGGIATQHRAVKHAAVRGKGDVTAESGVGGHEGGGVDDGLFHRQMPLSLSFNARIVPHFSRISTVRQEKSRRIFKNRPTIFRQSVV